MKITRIAILLLLGVLFVLLLPVQMATADDMVNIPDQNLEAVIREAISKPIGDIYESDLLGLWKLDASWRDIADLNGLEYCTNLRQLRLWENQISDISPLSSLTSLTELNLMGSQISDISPLSGLTSLTELNLMGDQISDISPLSGLTSLTTLYLWGSQLSDISPLSGLTSLRTLTLWGDQISDIEPLVDNPGLSSGDYVYLSDNPLSTTSIDTYIPQLEARGVEVGYNPIPSVLWAWIVIGFTVTLLVLLVVLLAVIIYFRVFRKAMV